MMQKEEFFIDKIKQKIYTVKKKVKLQKKVINEPHHHHEP
jgi:hypothetical protein